MTPPTPAYPLATNTLVTSTSTRTIDLATRDGADESYNGYQDYSDYYCTPQRGPPNKRQRNN